MKTKLPSIEEMLAFVHADPVLLEIAINVTLLDRQQRFATHDHDILIDALCDVEENISGILFDAIKQKFGVSDENEPYEILMQRFFAHSIFTVTRQQFHQPPAVYSFMQALPFSFPGSLNAFVTQAYIDYRLNGAYRDNGFAYSLKHAINEAILDGHPLTAELYTFLTGYAFQEFLNKR